MREKEPGIAEVVIDQYRVFGKRTRIEIGPLTVLAGENSAGKSSAMHPLLLLKQTLDDALDPGPLLLDGENIRLTSVNQMFSLGTRAPLVFGVGTTNKHYLELSFGRSESPTGLAIKGMKWRGAKGPSTEIAEGGHWRGRKVERVRFFLGAPLPRRGEVHVAYIPALVAETIRRLIHVSGMRGHLGRTQQSAAVGDSFPGTFDRYVASIIESWQVSHDSRLGELNRDLRALGLTWKVEARRKSDVALELRVGRLKKASRGGAKDLVSLADVGLGVSQVLPVLVALSAATDNQLVYIEQPELHLHPKAQRALARVITAAVKRGARVVVETHSALLLLALQTAVADETIAASEVKLHWFVRSPGGEAAVDTARIGPDGTFGPWPVDFDDVTLEAQQDLLDAMDSPAPRSAAKRR